MSNPMPSPVYRHFRIQTNPLAWQSVSDQIASQWPEISDGAMDLYGIWRNQIGRARDELNLIACGSADVPDAGSWFQAIGDVRHVETWSMLPTLRPKEHLPPQRQGNYAFRFFQTDPANWDEFLQLCGDAWPGFEASYDDCEIIGLWRYDMMSEGLINSVLLTRRPNLAAWERTKIPQGELEAEVRRKLSRRYELSQVSNAACFFWLLLKGAMIVVRLMPSSRQTSLVLRRVRSDSMGHLTECLVSP